MRFRLQFSVRALVILVTLGCVYLASWRPTKRYADSLQRSHGSYRDYLKGTQCDRATAILPLLICQDEGEFDDTGGVILFPRRYYLWFFGPKIKLPFESDWQRPLSAKYL